MISIRTVYPCVGCNHEISPSVSYCPDCGAKQPDSSNRLVYNLFSTRNEMEFHMTYGGDPILSLEDIETLAKRDGKSEYFQYFVGAYYLNSESLVKTSAYGATLKIENWWPVFTSGLGRDQGERVITLSFLE